MEVPAGLPGKVYYFEYSRRYFADRPSTGPHFEKGDPGWIHAELGMNCFVKGNGKELGDGATFYFLDTKFQFKEFFFKGCQSPVQFSIGELDRRQDLLSGFLYFAF